MFRFSSILLLTLYVAFSSCKKEGFITSKEARISISLDTLRFDTVFTSVGSITGEFKIFNENDEKLNLSSVKLMGGAASSYRMNVDGVAGSDIKDVVLAPNDSVYVFVTVTIDPNSADIPFIVQDSIQVNYNGNDRFVQLEAYGQNANFIRSALLTGNTVWKKGLPYVIIGGALIDTGATLTIEAGTRVYLHADAPLIIDGSLQALGTKSDSITFLSDRLDEGYRELPAGWPGIYFRESSSNNLMQYAIIKNSYQGVIADQPASNGAPKVVLEECVLDNIYETGVGGINSSIKAVNCLITNCGLNILLTKGGEYEFTHCTIASYSNIFILHKNPVMFVNNWDSVGGVVTTYNMNAIFRNNIFWGENGTVEDEVIVSRRGGNPFNVVFDHNIYKVTNEIAESLLIGNIKNEDPLFDSIDVNKSYYDFHIGLKPSPAINQGVQAGVPFDLDGKPRDSEPDLGCYEKQ